MRKLIMQLATMTMALAVGVAAAAPPAFADCCCHWRHHRHVAATVVHARWAAHPRWAYNIWNGWGPGVGFEAMTGIVVDHPPVYNHPYYYGGGPYGNCGVRRPVQDAGGHFLGWQGVYTC
jgi:hypothetical protein